MNYLYRIVNKISKESYIGISEHPFKRWEEHEKADSRVGDSMRKFGIESFYWEFIDAFQNRENAEKAEKHWIQRECPGLNGTHNPDPVPRDIFGGNHKQQPPTVVRPDQDSIQIDNKKMADNEHFKVLREHTNKIVVFLKVTGETVDILKNIRLTDMLELAPLDWWRSLLGITKHKTPTSAHTIIVADAMIRITQQRRGQNRWQGDAAGGQSQALQLIQSILTARVQPPGCAEDVSVLDAIRGKMKFIHEFGVRVSNNGNCGEGLLLAVGHQKFMRLLKGSRWKNSDLRETLRSWPDIVPLKKPVRFGKVTYRPVFIPEGVLDEIGFSTKATVGETRAVSQQPEHWHDSAS